MATGIRGRSGSRNYGNTGTRPYFTGGTAKTGWGSPTAGSKRSGAKKTGTGYTTGNVSNPWKQCYNEFSNKINSFKTLCNQTTGTATQGRPSPATLNTFAKWVNKGAVVYTVSAAQVARWAKATNKNFNTQNLTPTTCKNVLCAKFGRSTIKAVARTKNGWFMVATAPSVQGKAFCFPK